MTSSQSVENPLEERKLQLVLPGQFFRPEVLTCSGRRVLAATAFAMSGALDHLSRFSHVSIYRMRNRWQFRSLIGPWTDCDLSYSSIPTPKYPRKGQLFGHVATFTRRATTHARGPCLRYQSSDVSGTAPLLWQVSLIHCCTRAITNNKHGKSSNISYFCGFGWIADRPCPEKTFQLLCPFAKMMAP